MKNIFVLFVVLAMVSGCQKESENEPEIELHDIELAFQTALDKSACGEASLSWLHDLLAKAEEDRVSMAHKGNYLGIVSIIQYQGSTFFYTNFMMGSGGIRFYLFDCEGNHVPYSVISSFDFDAEGRRRNNIIYSSTHLD